MTAKIATAAGGEAQTGMSRRDFLASTAAVGGAMVLGFYLPAESARRRRSRASPGTTTPRCPRSMRG